MYHVSGMHYCSIHNCHYKIVNEVDDGFLMLYYARVDDSLYLSTSGPFSDINSKVLLDDDWIETLSIYKSYMIVFPSFPRWRCDKIKW